MPEAAAPAPMVMQAKSPSLPRRGASRVQDQGAHEPDHHCQPSGALHVATPRTIVAEGGRVAATAIPPGRAKHDPSAATSCALCSTVPSAAAEGWEVTGGG
jgi:hypothetical protein